VVQTARCQVTRRGSIASARPRRPSGAEAGEAACRGRCGGGSASPAKKEGVVRNRVLPGFEPRQILQLLSKAKTLAVVGLSPRRERDSHRVSAYLKENGYRIAGVNPNCTEALGEPSYPSLAALPGELLSRLDIVVVFRRPAEVPPLIEQMAGLGLRQLWLQIGVSSREALLLAEARGLVVVAERCIRVDHELLCGASRAEPGAPA
jgi:predicted CoA-binding protein